MNIQAYLDRIGYLGTAEPTAENLKKLQRAHLTSVPYENIDILLGRRILLDRESLFKKIVTDRRGGYCFELNELFGWLLSEIGYEVKNCVARYHRGETGMPKRRHQVLIVTVPDTKARFLCDVGVGAVVPMEPVPMDTEDTSIQSNGEYRIYDSGALGYMLSERYNDSWRDVYSFTQEEQYSVDFIFPSFWCEFAEDSPFNKTYMLAIRKGESRFTLDGNLFREFSESGVTERELSEDELQKVISEVFGIVIK